MGFYSKDDKQKNRDNIVGLIGIIIMVAAAAFVFFLFRGSKTEPAYTFSDHTLTISGQYGVSVDLEGADVTLEPSQMPAMEARTNGAAIGEIEKGYFRIGDSKVYLNVMNKSSLGYILITDKNGSQFYIVCATAEETSALYEEIISSK